MLNEDLMTIEEREINKLRLEVNRLRSLIDKFKEYDKGRKEYYSKCLIELGELKSFVEEMESNPDSALGKYMDKFNKLKAKCERQREALNSLNCIMSKHFNVRFSELKSDDGDILDLPKAILKINSLENENAELRRKLEFLQLKLDKNEYKGESSEGHS